jgi:YVTN family beta-propeller protein
MLRMVEHRPLTPRRSWFILAALASLLFGSQGPDRAPCPPSPVWEVVMDVTAGDYPGALCYNPQNNKVCCANNSSDDVTVIDGASNLVITTVPAGGWPCALCYNPQNNKVYCANHKGSSISVLRRAD